MLMTARGSLSFWKTEEVYLRHVLWNPFTWADALVDCGCATSSAVAEKCSDLCLLALWPHIQICL